MLLFGVELHITVTIVCGHSVVCGTDANFAPICGAGIGGGGAEEGMS